MRHAILISFVIALSVLHSALAARTIPGAIHQKSTRPDNIYISVQQQLQIGYTNFLNSVGALAPGEQVLTIIHLLLALKRLGGSRRCRVGIWMDLRFIRGCQPKKAVERIGRILGDLVIHCSLSIST